MVQPVRGSLLSEAGLEFTIASTAMEYTSPLKFGGPSKVEKISACATSKENIEPKTPSNLVRTTQKLGFEHGRLFFTARNAKHLHL